MPSDDVEEFRAVLRAAKNIIVVAGAGLSAASGIPTFRGAGGMWRSLDAMSLASPDAFAEDPSLVWQFYHYRREKALQSQPNAAHMVIAKLSVPSILAKVAPAAESFHLITQNVDGLSTKALQALKGTDTPSPQSLIEMHGRLFDVQCTKCNHVSLDLSSPLCAALGEADRKHADVIDAGSKEAESPIPLEDLPRCTACGSLARPGVVWFGEFIRQESQINNLVKQADLCLVVGTSSKVWPAGTYAPRVKANSGHVAEFNLEPSVDTDKANSEHSVDTDEANSEPSVNTDEAHSEPSVNTNKVDFFFLGGCETELPRVIGIDGNVEDH